MSYKLGDLVFDIKTSASYSLISIRSTVRVSLKLKEAINTNS